MMTDASFKNRQTYNNNNNNKMTQQSDQDEYTFRFTNPPDAAGPTTDEHHPPPPSDTSSAYNSTPWDQSSPSFSNPTPSSSPLMKSPWSSHVEPESYSYTGLMGSLVREEGHIYSLATSGDLLYTGSDSKNIRVWKNQKEFVGFKSNSGLVKAIVIAGERIFTGHQDGKIRMWSVSKKDPTIHKRIGTLPAFKDKIKSSFSNSILNKHRDAISSLSLSEDQNILYSASWDKTIKIWRISNPKFLESIVAHEDAVNSVISGFDGLVFTGSADGSVKVWRREMQGKGTKHFFSQTLLKQECAITALAVDPASKILYCGSSDGLVNFWEHDKFLSHGGILRGHKLAVLCLATLGNLVFSGSADTNICVWRKEEGEHVCLSVLSGHSGPVKCLAVEEEKGPARSPLPGEKHYMVYSGSLDKSVKIWRVSGQAPPMQTPPGPSSSQHQQNDYNGPQTFPSVQSFSSQDSNRMSRRTRY